MAVLAEAVALCYTVNTERKLNALKRSRVYLD